MLNPLVSVLLDVSNAVCVREICCNGDDLTLFVASRRRSACCPLCARPSRRAHSHYERQLADIPVGSRAVTLKLQVRRFFCVNSKCHRRLFAERIPDMVAPWQRKTNRLRHLLERIAFSVGANPGSELCKDLHLQVSASTLLRQTVPVPEPVGDTLTAVGVDDWAFKKGHTYGTILVDLTTGKAVDLLPDREKQTVIDWLKKHPEIEVVSRDRNASYAEAVREGAPQAVQVADRWHLLHNLAEVLERVLLRHSSCLNVVEDASNGKTETETGSTEPEATPVEKAAAPKLGTKQAAEESERQSRRARKQADFEQVHTLAKEGLSKRAIARQTGLSRVTVQNYLVTQTPPQRVGCSKVRSGHFEYALSRYKEGCTNLKTLHEELRQKGFGGSYSSLYRAMRPLVIAQPSAAADVPTRQKRISPRSAACRLLLRPDRRDGKDERFREKLRCASEKLGKVLDLADRFAEMLRKRQVEAFSAWLRDCQTSGISEFVNFARSLSQDQTAVEAALSLKWSNGVTEGNVNRLKMIKRQMYGRASFQLLRARVLHYP